MKKILALLPSIAVLVVYRADAVPAGSATDIRIDPGVSEARALTEICAAGLSEATRIFDDLERHRGPATVENVLEPYNDLLLVLFDGGQQAVLMQRVHPEPGIRRAAADCERRFSALQNRVQLSRPLYDLVRRIPIDDVDRETRRFIDLTLRDFRLAGVSQDRDTRTRIRAVQDEIIVLEQAFKKNITDDVRSISVGSRQELAGMPTEWIDARTIPEGGGFRVTTQYPDYQPFMSYAHSDDLRRSLFIEFKNRGYPANRHVLERLLEKRHELASLQGFPSWADRSLADKMLGDPAQARAFLESVRAAAAPRARADYAALLQELREIEPGAERVNAWQVAYLSNKLLEDRYGIPGEVLRRYFEYGRVRDGIFELTSDLFGMEVRPRSGAPVWHESVEAYEFVEDGRVLGRFYLDMHPREGKYKHTSHVYYRAGLRGRRIPESVLVCNFPGGRDSAARMEQRQVESFLHEFGHLVHYHLRYRQRWLGISQPERDFIEAPSQMLEEWIYDPETLARFAIDDSGEPIPVELVDRLREARMVGKGLQLQQQMILADLSLSIHDRPPDSFRLDGLYDEIARHEAIVPPVAEIKRYASFGHLGSPGYSATYYTYAWSQAIADDMATRFRAAGLRDRQTARDYRRTVLEAGGSRPAEEFIAEFLGRPFSPEAFRLRLSLDGDAAH